MLYVFALAFGLADAFYYPAQSAIVPQVLPREQLQAGNMLVQGAIKAGRTSPGKMISASLSSPAAAESPSKRPLSLSLQGTIRAGYLNGLQELHSWSSGRPTESRRPGQWKAPPP